MVEDCQQQRPAMRLRTVFMITGIGVHDPPESAIFSTDGFLAMNCCGAISVLKVWGAKDASHRTAC